MQINLALNYGSKIELIEAFKKLKKIKYKFTEKNFEKYLQTKNIPDPDILIRTGNTQRLSNFLLWQIAYAEVFFEKKLLTDFNKKDFNKIIKKYQKIKEILEMYDLKRFITKNYYIYSTYIFIGFFILLFICVNYFVNNFVFYFLD